MIDDANLILKFEEALFIDIEIFSILLNYLNHDLNSLLYPRGEVFKRREKFRILTENSVSRNGEFSQLWELLGAHREKKLWGIPH